MSNKFMPKKPTLDDFRAFVNHSQNTSVLDDFVDFINQYWNEHIEPLFKDAVRVTGHLYENGAVDFGSGNDCGDTHEALFIAIREIEKPKPKTDSEKLKSILDAYDAYRWDDTKGRPTGSQIELLKAIEKARKS